MSHIVEYSNISLILIYLITKYELKCFTAILPKLNMNEKI